MEKCTVLYNGSCPICSREIAAYRQTAERRGLAIGFEDLANADLSAWGLDADTAARQLHLRQGDRILSGLEAFRALWAEMPRLRWLATITGWPVVRPLAQAIYGYALAPALYAMHRRRLARADKANVTG